MIARVLAVAVIVGLVTAARAPAHAGCAQPLETKIIYQQSRLGGAYLLRGFTEGRFADRQSWTVEAEQRIRVRQTRMFGVVTDWRIDPFVAAGQVFGATRGPLAHPQVAAGVGLRAFVRPNLVARVDLADGGEGLKVYVELGYPY